jgi:hypothetical protein
MKESNVAESIVEKHTTWWRAPGVHVVNGAGRHLDLLNGGRRQLALLNGRRWGLPRFNGRRWGLARLREGRRVLLSVLNSGQWRRRRRACIIGGQSSVWHLVLKLRRLALKRRQQLVSAGGHGSPRPQWMAAPAGNHVSRLASRGNKSSCRLGTEGGKGGRVAPWGFLRKNAWGWGGGGQ